MSRTPNVAWFAALLVFASCDAGFEGNRNANEPPETRLSVRDESLVDNLGEAGRLRSTLRLSWVGDDADGFVAGFEVRTFPEDAVPGAEDGWTYTTSNDSLLLLPIPGGSSVANVFVQVRAVDDAGLRDPSPASTLFPIRNSPPAIALSRFELPPDTTFTIVSFAWRATDPDGVQNLASVSIGLNDSTTFVEIDPSFDFVTLVADRDQVRSGAAEVDAAIYLGRGVQATSLRLPGLRPGGDNTFYVRAVDQADTTSTIARHTWHVKRAVSNVLYVNDYRLANHPNVTAWHMARLRAHLPAGYAVDSWDLSQPYTTGSSGTVPRSAALPPVAEPMLRLTLSMFDYLYWVSSSTIGTAATDNMPFVAPALSDFFENGGRMLVHSPTAVAGRDTDFTDNAAVLLLPLSRPLVLPDSIGRLELRTNAAVTPSAAAAAIGLPALVSDRFFINVRPYEATGTTIVPLYTGVFAYRTTRGASGTWPGASTVASMSADRRIALVSIPLVNDQTGESQFKVAGTSDAAGPAVVGALLDALEFPKR